MDEIFKSIQHCVKYSVSDLGRIRNNSTDRILCPVISAQGYEKVLINNKLMSVHRLVALHHLPNPLNKRCVDHIDGNRTNNVLSNLRFATHSENLRNACLSSRNKSGVKGVSWDKCIGKWKAQIREDGKVKYLGCFDTIRAATEARHSKAVEVYGEYANETI
jgi:hypothetical protein